MSDVPPPPPQNGMTPEMEQMITRQLRITQMLKEQIASVVMANTEQAVMLEERDAIITDLRKQLAEARGEAEATS